MMATMTKKRISLIKHLEEIVGRSCYNPNIQNWGPNGNRLKEGRTFRYPITFHTPDGPKKGDQWFADLNRTEQMTGYYQLGANRLPIMDALNDVLTYLEENNGLVL
jgi:hypothetical protein